MNRLITTVCRHNQARSVLAASAIGRFFPNIEVTSAGIEGVEGQRIPQSILNLAEAWGLDVPDVVSHSLEAAQSRLFRSDLVIVAEDEFIPMVLDIGIASNKVLSMQDSRFDHSLIPFDPIGQRDQVLSAELAKAIMTTMHLIREREGFTYNYPVEAIFTLDETDFRRKLVISWENLKEINGILVLGDFRAPNFRAASQISGTVLELKVSRFEQSISFSDGKEDWDIQRIVSWANPLVISGRYEVDQSEKFALSTQFTSFIASLAVKRPVTILTEPLGLGPCALLVASSASVGSITGTI